MVALHGFFIGVLLGAILLEGSYAFKVSVSDLDNAQKNVLEEFRANVEEDLPHDYMKDDHYLLKFLSKNDFSINEATDHLHQHLEWRQKENVDQVMQEDWSDMERMFPYDLGARARNGNPILHIPVGRYNFREGIESGKLDKMRRYFGVKMVEDAAALVRRSNAEGNSEIVQFETIFDMDRDPSRSFHDLACIECLLAEKDWAETTTYHYPRATDNVFVVNAPPLLEYTFPWISGVVSSITMHVLGSRKSYEPFLLNFIEKDQFPKNLKYEL